MQRTKNLDRFSSFSTKMKISQNFASATVVIGTLRVEGSIFSYLDIPVLLLAASLMLLFFSGFVMQMIGENTR